MTNNAPENGAPPAEVNPLDLIMHGSDLPVSSTTPPSVMRTLLERPASYYTVGEAGNVSDPERTVVADPAVTAGRPFIASDPSWLIAIGGAELAAGVTQADALVDTIGAIPQEAIGVDVIDDPDEPNSAYPSEASYPSDTTYPTAG